MAGKELQAIVDAHERARARGQRGALVTVVKTSGSTYRRPGARMLVLAEQDGTCAESVGAEFLGSISGGCLEDDARERALRAIREDRPALVRYDTTAESDILFGTGAGCRGIVHAFIEPLSVGDPAFDPLESIARALRERRSGVLATVIGVEGAEVPFVPGRFLWVDHPAHGQTPLATTVADATLAETIAADARAAAFRGKTETRTYPWKETGCIEVFLGVIRPTRSLLICGAGHDAGPLVRIAKELGWRVRVVDGRRAYVTPERFPGADEIIHCPFSEFRCRVVVEPDEAAVIMTHHYVHDRDLLRALLSSPAGYIGLLGPRQRTERLLADVAADNQESAQPPDLGKHSLRRLHAPAGLDIGAEAPEQIALSIVAEIEAAAAGREGGMLKRRAASLHDPREA